MSVRLGAAWRDLGACEKADWEARAAEGKRLRNAQLAAAAAEAAVEATGAGAERESEAAAEAKSGGGGDSKEKAKKKKAKKKAHLTPERPQDGPTVAGWLEGDLSME